MVCGDPESSTDYSLKEVSAYIIWYRLHTWGFQVIFCALLCIIKHISVKNQSAEGTCLLVTAVILGESAIEKQDIQDNTFCHMPLIACRLRS